MLKLRSVSKSPPGGFVFQCQQTGWRHHAWSFNDTVRAWYQENVRRSTGRTKEQCMDDVEAYMCAHLMKTDGWQSWIIISDTHSMPFINSITPPPPLEYKVSVVIPVYRFNDNKIKRCLESVFKQSSEIIVVSDEEIIKPQNAPFKWVPTGQLDTSFALKCNLGAKQATGQYIWFLNDDCYPNPGCADNLLEVLNFDPKIGVVGHLLRYPDGRIQHGGTHREAGKVGFPHLDHGSLDLCTIRSAIECEAVTAASMMVKKEAFDAVGGFCEDYFLYLEDSDLCLKMRNGGWKVFYTPFAEAIHEEHSSSRQRTDLTDIIYKSVATFNGRWGEYYQRFPTEPQFSPIDLSSENIDAVYVHLVGDRAHEELAVRFIESALTYPPKRKLNWVIACNSPHGNSLSDEMTALFNRLGRVTFFKHDNSGWDIGAFQAYSRSSQSKFVLFLGSSAYFRRHDWLQPMVAAFRKYGPNTLYGTCGHLGDPGSGISPHLRTTGFWCAPAILNRYPTIVTRPDQRYPFEHGPSCFTLWCWSQGFQVLIVDAEGVYGYPHWNDGPQGYHRNQQSSLLVGDRLTRPPFVGNI